MAHATLREFVSELRRPDAAPLPEGEDWNAMIVRIHRTGLVQEVSEATYDWFLECLPPKYMTGGFFAFGEGAEPFKLFWTRKHGSFDHLYFVRALTQQETEEFCRLARIALPW